MICLTARAAHHPDGSNRLHDPDGSNRLDVGCSSDRGPRRHILLEHLLVFIATGMATGHAFPRRWKEQAIALVLFAFAIESAQLSGPGRHARLSDLVANILSVSFGLALAHLAARHNRLTSHSDAERSVSDREVR